MINPYYVFLGGTCGNNPWREEIVIPGLLSYGVMPSQWYNPVVKSWTKAVQEREDEAKRTARYQVYVVASPDPKGSTANVSGYSLVELVMALYDAPHQTVALFDNTGMANHTAKGMRKAASDLQERFPEAPIFTEYSDLINWLGVRLAPARTRR